MRPKELIDMFPYGYTRLRNQNGSVALTLDTTNADAFVFLKRAPKNHRMPKIDQDQIDMVQINFGKSKTIIDWYDNDDCRYFITTKLGVNPAEYKLVLNATFGEDVFEVTGYFYEKEHTAYREKIFNERFLKNLPPDALTTRADYTEERYDVIFPDDPLSHCRRLANVIAMRSFLPAELDARRLEDHNTSNSENHGE